MSIVLVLLALLCLIVVRKKNSMVIEITSPTNTVRGKNMIYEMDITQKRKLTAVPFPAGVDATTFTFEVVNGGGIVELEGSTPLSCYASAKAEGVANVKLTVVSNNGSLLEASVDLWVKPVAATSLTIEVGDAEPI